MLQIIGQNNFRDSINDLSQIPQFMILLGPKGSGKTMMSKWIAETRKYRYIEVGNKIADIRNLIENSVAIVEPTIYTITDGDNMTTQASNALLKLSEEPPHNLHIILELTDLDNTLPTILSRAQLFQLDSYTYNELKEYFTKLSISVEYEDDLLCCATTPGMINDYLAHNFDNMHNYIYKVYDNILKVSTGNSFKIRNDIAFKNEEDKYPPILFFNLFNHVTIINMLDGESRDEGGQMIKYTNNAKAEMMKKGANKGLIFDIWVLNIRTLR